MKSFITGSRAYGKPTPQSDVDLVVFLDQEAWKRLGAFSQAEFPQLRFGSLNIIACKNAETYRSWEFMTDTCRAIQAEEGRPVHKEEATAIREKWCQENGVMVSFLDYPTGNNAKLYPDEI